MASKKRREGTAKRNWRLWISLAALLLGLAGVGLALLPQGAQETRFPIAAAPQAAPGSVSGAVPGAEVKIPPVGDILAAMKAEEEPKGPALPLPRRDTAAVAVPPLPAPSAAAPPVEPSPMPPAVPPPAPPVAAIAPTPPASSPDLSPSVPLPAPPPVALPPSLSGTPAWKRFAMPGGRDDGRPMIAIVLDDVGVDHKRALNALTLPPPLTLSFMSYAEDLPRLTAAARAHGDEIMLHMPMQPQSAHVDPGPNALLASLDEAEIARRIAWDLARVEGIVGVNNHMGSRFTEDAAGMAVVMAALRAHGLFFLDSRTTPHTVGLATARRMGVPAVGRDIFLDDTMTEEATLAQLARTEAVARRNGVAIAIGHPHDTTVAALRRWLPTAAAHGFRLVPVTAIVARDQERAVAHSGE